MYGKSIYLILLIVFIFPSCSSNDNKKDNEWSLVWRDEFNGNDNVDFTKWDQPEYNRRNNDNGPDGWWLKEDSYLDGKGNLVIRARKISNRNSDNDLYDYSAGAVRSIYKFEQKFGKFEIRCQLPTQPGWWVAFWLMSSSVENVDGSGEDGTEIDIMEGFGWIDRINQALHWDGYGDDLQSEDHEVFFDGIRDGFHTFTLEWNKDEYIFFIDDIETWRTSAGGVSKVPAYIKITGELSTKPWAINEWWANNPENGHFPDYFLIDYVRVWVKK